MARLGSLCLLQSDRGILGIARVRSFSREPGQKLLGVQGENPMLKCPSAGKGLSSSCKETRGPSQDLGSCLILDQSLLVLDLGASDMGL